VQVWVNGESDETIGKLATALDQDIEKAGSRKLKAFFVFIPQKGEEPAAVAAHLQKLSDANKLHDVAFVYVTGPTDPAISDYKINVSPEVKNTVFAYTRHTTNSNFVNLKADEKGIAALHAATAKALAAANG
jgi:hypothetical protein